MLTIKNLDDALENELEVERSLSPLREGELGYEAMATNQYWPLPPCRGRLLPTPTLERATRTYLWEKKKWREYFSEYKKLNGGELAPAKFYSSYAFRLAKLGLRVLGAALNIGTRIQGASTRDETTWRE